MPVITGALCLYLKADNAEQRARWTRLVSAGMLIGLAALTQPGFLLFPGVVLASELLRNRPLRKTAESTVLIGMAMVMAILPWTVRNYLVFHRVVLISTNGGSVFYRANNPMANAG